MFLSLTGAIRMRPLVCSSPSTTTGVDISEILLMRPNSLTQIVPLFMFTKLPALELSRKIVTSPSIEGSTLQRRASSVRTTHPEPVKWASVTDDPIVAISFGNDDRSH